MLRLVEEPLDCVENERLTQNVHVHVGTTAVIAAPSELVDGLFCRIHDNDNVNLYSAGIRQLNNAQGALQMGRNLQPIKPETTGSIPFS